MSENLVYLTTKNFIFAARLEDLLNTNNIPYLKQGIGRAGLAGREIAINNEYKFFVSSSTYYQARKLLEEFFPNDNC